MKVIKTIEDANLAIKEIHDQLDALRTKDIDLHKRRVRNASPSDSEYDYVVRKELANLVKDIELLKTEVKDLRARIEDHEIRLKVLEP